MHIPNKSPSEGLVLLQVDDSTNFGPSCFHQMEEKASKKFEDHNAKLLIATPTSCNGMQLRYTDGLYSLDQSNNFKGLNMIPKDPF